MGRRMLLFGAAVFLATVAIGCGGARSLKGRWEMSEDEWIEFSKYRFVRSTHEVYGFFVHLVKYRGGYSISGNQIEFTYKNAIVELDKDSYPQPYEPRRLGTTRAFPFSRTKNTITIAGQQFIRVR